MYTVSRTGRSFSLSGVFWLPPLSLDDIITELCGAFSHAGRPLTTMWIIQQKYSGSG